MIMRKCRYCDHRGCTERGEEICTKYLLYIREDQIDQSCKGFEYTLDLKKASLIMVGLAVLILSIIML